MTLFSSLMVNNLMKKTPNDEIRRLGKEVNRFIREETSLKIAWIRKESHFGDSKFTQFLRGELLTISFTKFRNLMCTLRAGAPVAFDRWYNSWLKEFLTTHCCFMV